MEQKNFLYDKMEIYGSLLITERTMVFSMHVFRTGGEPSDTSTRLSLHLRKSSNKLLLSLQMSRNNEFASSRASCQMGGTIDESAATSGPLLLRRSFCIR